MKPSRATSHYIKLASRKLGHNAAAAEILGLVLYWMQGQEGGIESDGHRWTYRTASEIFEETGIPVRTVQRTLSALFRSGVLAHKVALRPPGMIERVTLFRALAPGEEIIQLALDLKAGKGRARSAPIREAANVAHYIEPRRRYGDRQTGGYIIQRDDQPTEHKSEDSMSARCADGESGKGKSAGRAGEKDFLLHLQVISEPCSTLETNAAKTATACINRCLKDAHLPQVQCSSYRDVNSALMFKRAIQDAGMDFETAAELVIRLWPVLRTMVPDGVRRYEGNEVRPNLIALGICAKRLPDLLSLWDPIVPEVMGDRRKASDEQILRRNVALASVSLFGAASDFLEIGDYDLWRGIRGAVHRTFERKEPAWTFDHEHRCARVIAEASLDPNFLRWARERAHAYLPRYLAAEHFNTTSSAITEIWRAYLTSLGDLREEIETISAMQEYRSRPRGDDGNQTEL